MLRQSQVLTDELPFHEYSESVALFIVLQGVLPKEPDFAVTRGYTKELWQLSTSCWRMDPSERPAVDRVLATLKSATGQWKPKQGETVASVSPWDGWSSLMEESDLPTVPKYEDEPVTIATITTFSSPSFPRPPVIRTPTPLARPSPHRLRSRAFDYRK